MWGCEGRPHPHIYRSLLLAGDFSVHSFMNEEEIGTILFAGDRNEYPL